MAIEKSITIEKELKQIAETLILSGTLTDCPGLIQGKTGIAIFFFHYARYVKNKLFEQYAMDLIREMQKQIHNNSPADYRTGLAGIGVGMDYLLTNHFIYSEVDIFKDFDERLFRSVMYETWQDFSLYDGLTGYGRYWLMRFNQPSSSAIARKCLIRIVNFIEGKLLDIQKKEQADVYGFLSEICRLPDFEHFSPILNNCLLNWDIQSMEFSRFGDSQVGKAAQKYWHNYYNNHSQTIETGQITGLNFEKETPKVGLLYGYAGEGMLRLSVLDSKLNWMNLF